MFSGAENVSGLCMQGGTPLAGNTLTTFFIVIFKNVDPMVGLNTETFLRDSRIEIF